MTGQGKDREIKEHTPTHLRSRLCLTEYSSPVSLARNWSHEHTVLQGRLGNVVSKLSPLLSKRGKLLWRSKEQPVLWIARITGIN